EAVPTAEIFPEVGMRTVFFSSAASIDPDGSIASVLWSFGDGETSTEADPEHTYSRNGTYTVRLVVTDNEGETGESEFSLDVDVVSRSIIAVDQIQLEMVLRNGAPSIRATVTVVNGAGEPMRGVSVTGRFAGVVRGEVTGVTNARGKAVLNSLPATRGGTIKFSVRSIRKAGYDYGKGRNVESSEARDVPAPRRRRGR
ncbi:MAG: PKD domain-containing protein, partial [Deltaproteobacteria bacterium]|nr:PKD domain-containing protein [Deltaproteobacteria bacterium]